MFHVLERVKARVPWKFITAPVEPIPSVKNRCNKQSSISSTTPRNACVGTTIYNAWKAFNHSIHSSTINLILQSELELVFRQGKKLRMSQSRSILTIKNNFQGC